MPELLGVPLHPSTIHLPIAGSIFAALMLALGLRGRDKGLANLNAAIPILALTLLSIPLAVWSGRGWAISLALLDDGAWLPAADTMNGFMRRHVLLAAGGSLALLAGLPLSIAARNRRITALPALIVVLIGAALLGAAAHHGGVMVHDPLRLK